MAVTKTITKLPKAQVQIAISMPWEDLEPKWNQTLAKMAQDVEIAGFRKGQAPLNLVEQQLSTRLQDEVLKLVMPQGLIEALQGTNVVPIDYPKYQGISFQKGGELKYTAIITERPLVSVGSYKTIKVTRPLMKEVTDEEAGKVIEDIFKRWKLRQPTTQTSNVSPQQPDNSAPQPANAQAGGSLNFNQSQNLPQANPVQAAISEVPDDNFAKAVGAQSLADLKVKIKSDLEAEAKYNNELDYEEAILQEVEKITQVEIPDILIQDELARMMLSLQRNVTDRGMLLDEYLKTQGKTADKLKEEWKPQAERNVRMELGLSEVARMENVNISDEELQAEIDKIQDGKVKSQFNQQEPRLHLRHALRQTKTLNLLKTLVG